MINLILNIWSSWGGGGLIAWLQTWGTNIPQNHFQRSYDVLAAAAAKSLQSCPTLCDPVDGSPPGSPIPGILNARILEWVAISFSSA